NPPVHGHQPCSLPTNMTSPRLSIVTPSYNQAEFIADTLESVRNQVEVDIEHLVLDGGSTDGTRSILEDHETAVENLDSYQLTWTSEPDEGQSEAINKGFERVTGDVVAWLNSDDVYFDVNTLSRVAGYFERYDDDVIYGDLARINRDSVVTAVDPRPRFDRSKLPYRILLGQPATFFRRRVVDAEKLDTELDYGMDYEYWLRLAEQFSFRYVPDLLAGFRSYPTQKSRDQTAMAAELESILTEYADYTRGSGAVIFDNLSAEVRRLVRGVKLTYELHRTPPELAFDGELASLPVMVRNLGPETDDVRKAWRRWRSGGASG
ncbi:MAG: glycosyltransferase family 2 protein, partial [Halobacteriales archaeon]|nr:glycosyltransferase family 2 protein [Halobacteriales archaeon]